MYFESFASLLEAYNRDIGQSVILRGLLAFGITYDEPTTGAYLIWLDGRLIGGMMSV